jgi:hypothetical protein
VRAGRRSGPEAIRGPVHRLQVAGLLPEDEFDQVSGREQVRIRLGLVGLHRRQAVERGCRRAGVGEDRLDAEVGDSEFGHLDGTRTVGRAQRQQVAQPQAGQVLPVNEGARDPAPRQEPGHPPLVRDLHGPVERVPQIAVVLEPRRRAFMEPAHRLASLQQVAEDLRE